MHADDKTARIHELNDELRCNSRGGRVMLTRGVLALGATTVGEALIAIASFRDFTEDNDPYGEHDFGTVDVRGNRIFWKIDCYDKALTFGSPDPADPAVTERVMTVMLADEY